MRSYEIGFNGLLDAKSGTTQCACSFKIKPINPRGKDFCFDVKLGRRAFDSFCSMPKLGLKEEDAKWILLKYGIEETKRALREGNEKERRKIKLILSSEPGGNLPSFPEVSNDEKKGLQKFIKGETIDYKI